MINAAAMAIVFCLTLIAAVGGKKKPRELVKLLAFYLLCGVGVVALALLWGANLNELLTLRLVSKSGVAVGIMYGCIAGSGVAYAVSLLRHVGSDEGN